MDDAGDHGDADHADDDGAAAGAGDDEDAKPAKKKKRVHRDVSKDAEFGVARGVDFKGVGTVVNVDVPSSVESYTHRIGRTARAGASGVALTFVSVGSKIEAAALEAIQEAQGRTDAGDVQPQPLPFNRREIETFRYR